ncbi:hypothetical protein LR48_Vigan10g242700 [Vigna angularis]|uniref:Uncharacterized protein n=1 Tax=Phaseolus angularis TaxID=3914 RepID=A0A0L9VNA8_PHAAN|nr:hypothetical protein LR48_Vigan10g242700 [Vigna angularis]
MDKEVSEMASLRVRHRVQTQHIVQVNGCLSSFQKERLKSTPFKWLVDLVDDMVISSPILIELISRSYHEVIHMAGCATVLQESQTYGGKSNPESNDENVEFARLVEEQRVLMRRVDKHAERLDELQMKIRRLEEQVQNEMPSSNDGMEGPSTAAGPSTADKMNDLAIVNFVDVGIEGASRQDNIDFRSVYTTCTSSLCHDGDVALVEVSNNILTRGDLQCFRPRAKIDNITTIIERMKIPKKKENYWKQ